MKKNSYPNNVFMLRAIKRWVFHLMRRQDLGCKAWGCFQHQRFVGESNGGATYGGNDLKTGRRPRGAACLRATREDVVETNVAFDVVLRPL